MRILFILFLSLIPIVSNADSCFSYIREYEGDYGNKSKEWADFYIKDTCKSGQILDFRVYQIDDKFKDEWRYDILINRQTKFCNYDKEITTIENDYFIGFTCEVKFK